MKRWSLDARSSRQSCPYPKDETGHKKKDEGKEKTMNGTK